MSESDNDWTMHSIGFVHSPLKQKFGLPRQPGLVPQLKGHIEIIPPYDRDEAFNQLTGYSHIWVIGVFHLAHREYWQSTVRPPRLGGNERVGVFASRSPFRPNPIGMSLCRLDGISRQQGKLSLAISGCDLVHGTPVLDIKPYLPYSDSVSDARAGFTDITSRELLEVTWSPEAQQQLVQFNQVYPEMADLITSLLAQDPRPAYQKAAQVQEYGMQLYEFNIRFVVQNNGATVTSLEKVASED